MGCSCLGRRCCADITNLDDTRGTPINQPPKGSLLQQTCPSRVPSSMSVRDGIRGSCFQTLGRRPSGERLVGEVIDLARMGTMIGPLASAVMFVFRNTPLFQQ